MTHFKECVADLTMPKGWTDCSWHNDTCPSWLYRGFQVMIDHPDFKQRETNNEDENATRFYIFRAQEYGDAPTWNAECHTFKEVLSILNDEETWHAVARAFVSRHGYDGILPWSARKKRGLDIFLNLYGHAIHPEYKAEGEAIMRLFDWHDVDDAPEPVVEESEPTLRDALEDITGQMQSGKIGDRQVLEIISNIVDNYKKEQS